MPWYVSSPERVVPQIVGKKLADAEKMLTDNDLDPVISDTTYDERYPQGTILLQKPLAGEKVKIGRRLAVSGGDVFM